MRALAILLLLVGLLHASPPQTSLTPTKHFADFIDIHWVRKTYEDNRKWERITKRLKLDIPLRELVATIEGHGTLTSLIESQLPDPQSLIVRVQPGFLAPSLGSFSGSWSSSSGSAAKQESTGFSLLFEAETTSVELFVFTVILEWKFDSQILYVSIQPGTWHASLECSMFAFELMQNLIKITRLLQPKNLSASSARIRLRPPKSKTAAIMVYFFAKFGFEFESSVERERVEISFIAYLKNQYSSFDAPSRWVQREPENYIRPSEWHPIESSARRQIRMPYELAEFKSRRVVGRSVGWLRGQLGKEFLLSGEAGFEGVLYPNQLYSPGMYHFREYVRFIEEYKERCRTPKRKVDTGGFFKGLANACIILLPLLPSFGRRSRN